MGYIYLKKQLKGKVSEACVVPACAHRLGILALTEKQAKQLHAGKHVK